MSIERDVVIIGAGPAGLALAVALAAAGLRSTLLERQPRAVLADPAPDGRDIALTHRGMSLLRSLGIAARFPEGEVSLLRAAHVVDGTSPFRLAFDARNSGHEALGFLVANHVIRRAAYDHALSLPAVELIDEAVVTDASTDDRGARVQLADGRVLQAPLLVAADSRFSETRRRLGIGADLHDFGRTVIVARMRHGGASEGIAHECFHYGQTLAVLPLNGGLVSTVVTTRSDRARELMALPPQQYADMVRDRFGDRLGPMALDGDRHPYPLVATWAHRFATRRAVLIGDAAVGMHPVTAHGYNFGLYGVDALVRAITPLHRAGRDIADPAALARFDSEHRRTTWPIYLGTNAIVRLFTDDRVPARLLRGAVLRVADRLAPLKAGITRQLTGGVTV